MADISKRKQGFASLSPERRREIASLGGKRAHELKKAHRWSSSEARAMGQKSGGRPRKQKTEDM